MASGAMLGAVYDAFLEAGVSPEKARHAAEAVAAQDNRVEWTERYSGLREEVAKLRQETTEFRGEVSARFAKIEGEITLLKWIGGVNTAGVIAILVRTFFT